MENKMRMDKLFARATGTEDISRREANVKHFDLGGGRHQALTYAMPVHFKDASGAWQEIDNTLEEAIDAWGRRVLRNRANAVRMEFPCQLDGSGMVSISKEDKTFSWGFEQQPLAVLAKARTGAELKQERLVKRARAMAKFVGRTVESLKAADLSSEMETEQERRSDIASLKAENRYDEVLPGVSVRYTLCGERVKEDILLADAAALERAAIRLPKNYDYRLTEEGELMILDPQSGEVEFRMGVPVVYDAEGRQTVAAVSLEPMADYTRMTYGVDAQWLTEAAFPITIDPVVITKVEDAAIEDAYIWNNPSSDYWNTNFGKAHLMRCGLGKGGESISLIRFKSLVNQRASDTIISAQLRTVAYAYPDATEYFGCYPIKTPWTETGVTWKNMTPENTNHIGDEILSYVSGTNGACYFDITNLYRSWYQKDGNGASRNFGVALRYCGNPAADKKYVEWYAAKYDSESEYGPCMIVNYVSHAGQAAWWQYEGMSAGRAGSASVDLYNGNLVYQHADAASTGARMPVTVGHVYNSCLSASDPLGCGMGWRTTLHQSLYKTAFGTMNYYVWTDGSGTDHYFHISGAQPYKDMEGMELKLSVNADNITIVDKSHSVMTFPKATSATPVWLEKIEDSCGNAMAFSYLSAGRISKVTDGAGRETVYAYDAAGKLLSIEAPGCPKVSYYYADDRLTAIGYADLLSGGTTFSYREGTALLTGAANFDGVGLSIAYEDPNSYDAAAIDNYSVQACRVLSMEQTASGMSGAKMLFEYLHMTTRVTSVKDSNSDAGKTITYQFNAGGNVVSMYDELGYAQFNAFSASIPNQQTGASKLQRAVTNHLRGLDFSAHWTNEPGTGATMSVDAGERCLGLPSLKSQKPDFQGSQATQEVWLKPGRSYTFSAYAKTVGSDAQLWIAQGNRFRASQLPAGNGRWERLFVTLDVAEGTEDVPVTVALAHGGGAGTAWFAAPQLETGSIPNRVNLLENSHFVHYTDNTQVTGYVRQFPEGWVAGSGAAFGYPDNGVVLEGHGMPASLEGNALRMTGYVNNSNVCFNQTLNVSGQAGDTFVLGGWLSARSVANHHPLFSCRFHNSDTNAWTAWADNQCNNQWVGWQFVCFALAAPVKFDQMEVSINYGLNAQSALFGSLFLHREQFGESFAYDDDKNLISTSNLSGEKSKMEYDAFDNLTSYIRPGAAEADKYLFTYGDTDAEKKKHLVRTETTPMGARQTYTYDAHGNRLTVRAQKQGETAFIQSETGWSADGNYAVSATDARGSTVTKTVDSASGLVYNVTDPAGQMVEYGYDSANRVTGVQAETADGKAYKNAYTYENDRIKTVAHNTTGADCDVTYTFGYDALGRKTTVKVGSQALSTNVYADDRSGLLKEVRYGNGGKVSYEHDEYDRLTGVKYDGEAQPRYEYEYGANGRASFVKDNHLGRKLQTEYDLSERPCQTTIRDAATDNLIYQTTLDYDGQNRLTSFKEQTANGAHKTVFSYDKDNRTTAIQYDGDSQKVEYVYDGLGRITSRKVTNGSSVYNTQYEFVTGDTTKYGAGATTPLVRKITQPGMNFEYEYDNRGNIISEKRNGLETKYQYDALGQLIYVNDPHENAIWYYTYDCGGNILEKKKYARNTDGTTGTLIETIPYEYGDSNWKDKLTKYNGKTITYDAIGNPLDDGERQYEWEAGRRLKKVIIKDDSASGIKDAYDAESDTRFSLEFTNGNFLANGVTSTIVRAHVYCRGQEVTEQYASYPLIWRRDTGDAAADDAWWRSKGRGWEITLTEADMGAGRKTKISCMLSGIMAFFGSVEVDENYQAIHTWAYTDENDRMHLENGILSVESEENTYFLEGNVLKAQPPLYSGSLESEAWVYTEAPTKTITYEYNENGLRVRKLVESDNANKNIEYIYQGNILSEVQIAESSNGLDAIQHTAHFYYDDIGLPTFIECDNYKYAYVVDGNDNICGLIDNGNVCVADYKYDAYGNPVSITHSDLTSLNPLRYRGYEYDEDAGFYYLKSRWYHPQYQRFIQPDTLLIAKMSCLEHNLFTYCLNSPENFCDRTGKSSGVPRSKQFRVNQIDPSLAGMGGAAGIATLGIFSELVRTLGNLWSEVGKLFRGSQDSNTQQAVSVGKKLSDIAGSFGLYQCNKAAEAMVEYLRDNKKQDWNIILLYCADRNCKNQNIWSDTLMDNIATNGVHVGVMFEGIVRCNVHWEGLDEESWLADFYSVSGLKHIHIGPNNDFNFDNMWCNLK